MRSWPNLEAIFRHSLGGTEESHEKVTQDSRSPVRYMTSGSPEYKVAEKTTQPRRSVFHVRNFASRNDGFP
jgi:hypothetical protein